MGTVAKEIIDNYYNNAYTEDCECCELWRLREQLTERYRWGNIDLDFYQQEFLLYTNLIEADMCTHMETAVDKILDEFAVLLLIRIYLDGHLSAYERGE